jgi:hypothetical protein
MGEAVVFGRLRHRAVLGGDLDGDEREGVVLGDEDGAAVRAGVLADGGAARAGAAAKSSYAPGGGGGEGPRVEGSLRPS